MIRYYLARVCHFLCGRLASLGGEIMYLTWPRARSWLWENMAHILGPRASRGEIRALTQAIVSSLERMVRRYPDQWYVFRRLWV